MAPKSRFASKGAFDALALDESDADQDLSEDVVVAEESTLPKSTAKVETPSKNIRSARKSTKKTTTPAKKIDVTDSDNDLEVMTTRSGSKIRHSSVPALQEEEETSPINGTIKSAVESVSNVIPTIKEPQDEEKGDNRTSPSLQVPDAVYGKQSLASSKQLQQSRTKEKNSQSKSEEEIESEARKAYWKKIYERTVFSLFMIGGFTGNNCREGHAS